MITDWTPENVVAEVRAAEAAARAVDAVPGVVRRQPGVVGLIGQFLAEAWQGATGTALPDLGGVTATWSGAGELELDVQIVVDARHRACDVGSAARVAAAGAAAAALDGGPVLRAVRVRIAEVDLYGRG